MRAPEALPASQRQDALFRLLVQSVEDYAIFLMGPTGLVETWNEGAQRILGFPASAILGKDQSLFYPPSELRRGKPDYVLRAATEEGRFEEEDWRVREDGSRFWAGVAITALRGPDGSILGFAKVIRDLTERKEAEDSRNRLLALEREARTRTEQLVAELRALQSITEAALAHLDLDSLLHALLDRLSEVLEVDTVAVLLLTDDQRWLVPRAAKGIEEEVQAGIRLPLGHGFAGRIAAERRPIVLDDVEHAEVLNPILRHQGIRSLLGVPLLVEGRPLGVLHVGTLHMRRFTEDESSFLQVAADRVALAIEHARLYETAERARQAAESAGQQLQMRDEFLSVAAHELRTPITGLRAATQVVTRQLRRGDDIPPERLTQMMNIIDHESEKLIRLVSQLLDVSRLEGGRVSLELSPFDLAALVRSLVTRVGLAAPGANIRVESPDTFWISADALRIEQVLQNLLDNAVKFSPEGGEITIDLTRPGPNLAHVAVRDHGIGLSPAEYERVFDRFYQVASGERTIGLGLGLYISREIIERHGGRIWVESPPDGGTRFLLELPVGPVSSPLAQADFAQ
jgi:PAS domain S-box-containing protein